MSELKLYQSIKKVHAQPKTDVDYNECIRKSVVENTGFDVSKTRGILSNVDTDNPREGYLVIYQKDQPNQYISWCPKTEFEEGNIACDVEVNIPRIDYRHAMWQQDPHIVSELVSYNVYLRVLAELTTGRFVDFDKIDNYIGDKKDQGHIVIDIVAKQITWDRNQFTDFVYEDDIPDADFLQELLRDAPLEV